MIQISFPDGAVREYQPGVSAMDVAKSISEGLARKVLAAKVNGQVWDATREIVSLDALKTLLVESSAPCHGRRSIRVRSRILL